MSSTVNDVMTTNVVAIPESAGFKDIVIAMRQRRVSAFPVLDAAGRVTGVVSEADLLAKEVGPEPFVGPGGLLRATGRRAERAKAAGVTAADLMSTPPVTIGPDASVAEAARLMYERGVKRLPVVDEDGRLAGIISRVDVLSVFPRPDEQIRAEVQQRISGAGALGATVASGIVTLTGQARSRAAAGLAIDAAYHVEGVVDVRDRISYPAASLPETA
jgi:CBS domain-containing protein